MRGPHNIWRLVRTAATFERTGALKLVLESMDAPLPLRITARVLGWPFKWLGLKGDPALPPETRALQALGPAYIKFGQVLSTRPDMVGEDLAAQLRVLQDNYHRFRLSWPKQVLKKNSTDLLTKSLANLANLWPPHPSHRCITPCCEIPAKKLRLKFYAPALKKISERT